MKKVNKKYLLLRILTFPIKLIFSLLWFNLFALLKTYQWVIFGGDEIIFGTDINRDSVGELIKIVSELNDNYKNNS